ncbi:MAG: NERD domain-containing protein [Clostridia bacterium]|nr:NERD domain-containing protein [Clostridia bacterium]
MSNIFKTALHRTRAKHLPPIEEIEAYGADGEEAMYRLLCKSFDCVLRNPVVPHKKLYLEKDFLVIEKGIPFVIEVKNWKGEIGTQGSDFYQKKPNGVQKKQKSPVGTTLQFIEKMKSFYSLPEPVYGIVAFTEPDCILHLPKEMQGITLCTAPEAVAFVKAQTKGVKTSSDTPDPSRILRCTRFYSRDSEFCKGILADCYFDCNTPQGSVVRIDTTCLKYLSVEPQPLLLRDKLYLTYTNGATDIFYNRDTVFTVACLDGSYQKIALNRIRHIVF